MTDRRSTKAEEINLVLSEPDVNLWKLRELALTEGGLVNDTLRKRAWPKLVGLHGNLTSSPAVLSTPASPSRKGLPPKKGGGSLPPSGSTATMTSRRSNVSKGGKTTATSAKTTDDLPAPLVRQGNSFPTMDSTDDDDDDDETTTSASSMPVTGTSPSRRKKKKKSHTEIVAKCQDADQIERDVARCTWHLLTGSQRQRRLQMQYKGKKKVATLLKRKQRRLGNFINITLLRASSHKEEEYEQQDRLCYYQGYHDVACIFLSALGGGGGSGPLSSSWAAAGTTLPTLPATSPSASLDAVAASMGLDLPSRVLVQVSKSHLRDSLRSNFTQLQHALRLILLPLIGAFDSEVYSQLYYCDMEPYFALSWIITWFSHEIRDTDLVKRLFDAFVVSHPLLPVYMSVAMVLHPVNRMEVLSAECDFASVHQALAGLPKNSCSVGWKYKVGDGYVSGDEVEDDDGTISTDMDASFISEDILLEGRDDDGSHSTLSIPNMIQVGSNARVPFQVLIDTAISYMRRIPPRNLMMLAHRYQTVNEELLAQSSSIALLQPPPSWGLASTTPSDWVLKQRARETCGMSATSRKDRRVRSRARSRSTSRTRGEDEKRQPPPAAGDKSEADDANKQEEIEKYLAEKNKTLAVIALGFGPGFEEEKRRKRRKLLVRGSIIVIAIVSISLGVAMQYRPDLFGRMMIKGDSTKHDAGGDADLTSRRMDATSIKKASPVSDAGSAASSRSAAVPNESASTSSSGSQRQVPPTTSECMAESVVKSADDTKRSMATQGQAKIATEVPPSTTGIMTAMTELMLGSLPSKSDKPTVKAADNASERDAPAQKSDGPNVAAVVIRKAGRWVRAAVRTARLALKDDEVVLL